MCEKSGAKTLSIFALLLISGEYYQRGIFKQSKETTTKREYEFFRDRFISS
jgi:hypothetical protein